MTDVEDQVDKGVSTHRRKSERTNKTNGSPNRSHTAVAAGESEHLAAMLEVLNCTVSATGSSGGGFARFYGAHANGSRALNCPCIRSSAPRNSTMTERCAR